MIAPAPAPIAASRLVCLTAVAGTRAGTGVGSYSAAFRDDLLDEASDGPPEEPSQVPSDEVRVSSRCVAAERDLSRFREGALANTVLGARTGVRDGVGAADWSGTAVARGVGAVVAGAAIIGVELADGALTDAPVTGPRASVEPSTG
jgi:hypothetical protein